MKNIEYRDLPIYFVNKFETTWNGSNALHELYESKSFNTNSFWEFKESRTSEQSKEINKVLEKA